MKYDSEEVRRKMGVKLFLHPDSEIGICIARWISCGLDPAHLLISRDWELQFFTSQAYFCPVPL